MSAPEESDNGSGVSTAAGPGTGFETLPVEETGRRDRGRAAAKRRKRKAARIDPELLMESNGMRVLRRALSVLAVLTIAGTVAFMHYTGWSYRKPAPPRSSELINWHLARDADADADAGGESPTGAGPATTPGAATAATAPGVPADQDPGQAPVGGTGGGAGSARLAGAPPGGVQ